MNAPLYIIKNLGLDKYSKYTMDLHLNRLQGIRGRKNQHMFSTPSPTSKSNKGMEESKGNIGKKQQIDRQNLVIYQKLSNISSHNASLPMRNGKSARMNFKSSYQIFREHQERKIAVENEQIVKKLTEAKPVVKKKTLDEEYLEFKKRKRRLLKLTKLDETGESLQCKPSFTSKTPVLNIKSTNGNDFN